MLCTNNLLSQIIHKWLDIEKWSNFLPYQKTRTSQSQAIAATKGGQASEP